MFRTLASCVAGVAVLGAAVKAAESAALPHGPAPAPIPIDHFPDRFHAFVFRNWGLAPAETLARVAGTEASKIVECAVSMGLPAEPLVSSEMLDRGYITLLRRNWHLLPYDQLLDLVGMSEGELSRALREDDFLWVKFGRLKPECGPLRHSAPDPSKRERAAAIRQIVRKHFAAEFEKPAEPRFDFIRRMTPARSGRAARERADESDSLLELRFIYSYFGLYGDPLLHPELDPYPDGLLERLADAGVNGVWLHVVLRDLAGGALFPEDGAEIRLRNLQRLVDRAARFGVGVYLYLNEPRAMPLEFYRGRPELKGVQEGGYAALCTSSPAVQAWLRESVSKVFRSVDGLAGAFTITASENLTNCASHGRWKDCPRCAERSPDAVIAEVNAIIGEAIWAANPEAKAIFWDWGWRGHGEAPELIAQLPPKGWLMSVSEWGLPLDRGGVSSRVGEYSISAVGPGPRAAREWQWARERGLKTAAKVQLNNTWELSSIPYLPVEALVAQHCSGLAKSGVDGMMLSWTLGGYPSPNLEIASRFSRAPTPSPDQVLADLAERMYGPKGAPQARAAWEAFADAFVQYPFDGRVVYRAPVQLGPANLLYPKPTGYAATMTGIPYDDLNGWRGPYPAEVFAAQFEKMAEGWQSGLEALRPAWQAAPRDQRAEADTEWRCAKAAGLYFKSVANQVRFILHRDKLLQTGAPSGPEDATEGEAHRAALRRILSEEIDLAKQLHGLARADSRIGFEAANQYFYVPNDLVEKVINCEFLLERL